MNRKPRATPEDVPNPPKNSEDDLDLSEYVDNQKVLCDNLNLHVRDQIEEFLQEQESNSKDQLQIQNEKLQEEIMSINCFLQEKGNP